MDSVSSQWNLTARDFCSDYGGSVRLLLWFDLRTYVSFFWQEEKEQKIRQLTAELESVNQQAEVYRANLLAVLKDMEEEKLKLSVKVQNARLSLKEWILSFIFLVSNACEFSSHLWEAWRWNVHGQNSASIFFFTSSNFGGSRIFIKEGSSRWILKPFNQYVNL